MDFDVVIIGAGVVGLAVGRSLVKVTTNTCIIDQNQSYGMETSSRNSEVIHSGIYYPKNSLKSKLCIEGNQLIYDYCDEKLIPYKNCGKLIIANDKNGLNDLQLLKNNAEELGIVSKLLNKDEIKVIEPLINADYALKIKSSGVVDSHALMTALYCEISDNNLMIAYKTKVIDIFHISGGYEIEIKNPDGTIEKITTKVLINCAGLGATSISVMLGLESNNYKTQYWKGSYFWINNNKSKLINSLIYPVPNKNLSGLGIHTTKDLSGRVKLGPDAEYLGESEKFDYSVSIDKKWEFYECCKEYLPFLKLDDIEPDFSGVRPKLQKPGEPFKDFVIKNEKSKGFVNFINLLGIESPGLTSSLSIGKYVINIIDWDKI